MYLLPLLLILTTNKSLAAEVQIECNNTARVFAVQDYTLTLPDDWAMADVQIHDAYDADRNNQFIRIVAVFRQLNTSLRIPAFAMKEKPGAAWTWHIRWCPTRSGTWTIDLHCDLRSEKMKAVLHHQQLSCAQIEVLKPEEIQDGFLRYPDVDANQRYFQISDSSGQQRSELLYGNCRAWMVSSDSSKKNSWQAHEWADRSQELLPNLREGGYNVLNTWFAPWEYQIIHCDQAEYWRQDNDQWQRQSLGNDWSAYQSYDQGRARHFDHFLAQCEGDEKKKRIYLLLAPLPHVSFQMREHPWGTEGNWSAQDDPFQSPEKLNGFSLVPGQKEFWDFFKADPMAPLADWRSKLFDHQANYFRYLIARWGASPSIGIWELFDEIDAIGPEVGFENMKKGWWAQLHHAHNSRWLENISLLFTGNLRRIDALIYDGDAYQHPLHVATTSHAGEYSEVGNMHWTDIPGQRMSVGWHWYPFPQTAQIASYWLHCITGINEFSNVWKNKRPHFISEFGNFDRSTVHGETAIFYPSLYHFGIWASCFAGQAITAMDWDDGKEYGELRWRQHKPDSSDNVHKKTDSETDSFGKKHYPIDNLSRMKALRRFTSDIDWNSVKRMGDPGFTTLYSDRTRSLSRILFTNTGTHCWAFIIDDTYRCRINGLQAGKYTLTFFDPWTGNSIGHTQTITVNDQASYTVDGSKALTILSKQRGTFSKTQRLYRGYDMAWKLIPTKRIPIE